MRKAKFYKGMSNFLKNNKEYIIYRTINSEPIEFNKNEYGIENTLKFMFLGNTLIATRINRKSAYNVVKINDSEVSMTLSVIEFIELLVKLINEVLDGRTETEI